jgi:hypothetical protein
MEPTRRMLPTLPTELVFTIIPFLKTKDQLKLYSTAQIYHLRKRSDLYILLDTPQAMKFYENDAYRKKVLASVHNPSKQVEIILEWTYGWSNWNVSNLLPFKGIYKLALDAVDISNFYHFQSFANINYLSLTDCGIKNGHVASILQWCSTSLQYLNLSLNHITDVSNLGNIPILILRFSLDLVDLSGLGKEKQMKVDLGWSPLIEDVHSLGNNVKDISLRRCKKVKDISMLTNAKTLDLRECDNCLSTSYVTLRAAGVRLIVSPPSAAVVGGSKQEAIINTVDNSEESEIMSE